jgi:spherulation-specific family 4 protein
VRKATRPQRRLVFASVGAAGAIVLLVLLLTNRSGTDRRPSCRNTLIPAYVLPPAIVDAVQGPVRARLIVINPHNGPGAEEHAQYRDAVRAAQRAGARVLGYVPTSYGTRPAADVEADIGRYASWYGVDDIFLDEASSDAVQLPYYEALARRIRSRGRHLVVLNPGAVPARGYFDLADVIVTFEGPYSAYAGALDRMPAWVRDEPAGRIAHLVYGASREQALSAVSASDGAGYLYLTSGSPPDPWRTVPSYLREEEQELAACS